MSADMSNIVDQMRSALAASDPDLDTSAGTTTRKILDAVAESIAEAYLDQHMLHYQYDVDSKTGGDLDTFCQVVGGITRLPARRATGSVTVSVGPPPTVATDAISIPFGTQIASVSDLSIVAATITGATIMPGENNTTIPVQMVTPGVVGNVAVGVLQNIISPADGIATVSNLQAMSGGADIETDAELRARWKQTAFRSMAGTSSMFEAQALNNENVSAVKVIGSSLLWTEQIQPSIAQSGTYAGKLVAQSVNPDCAYVFPYGVVVGGDIDNGYTLPQGSTYTVDTSSTPPTIVFNDQNATYDTGTEDDGGNEVFAPLNGGILDLQYRFTPMASRNDPDGTRFGRGTLMNKVDVIIAGQTPTAVRQSLTFTNYLVFSSTKTSAYYANNYQRVDGSNPTVGNIFVPLHYGPIISVPDMLTIGTKTYGRIGATTSANVPNAYCVVHDVTPDGMSFSSRFGLEFVASTAPATGTAFTIGDNSQYIYDASPANVQAAIDTWRLVGTDVAVHAAIQRSIRVSCIIMYNRGVTRSDVNTAIQTALSGLFSQSGLGATLQVSDVEATIHSVNGVDSVRLATPGDYSGWTYIKTNIQKRNIALIL